MTKYVSAGRWVKFAAAAVAAGSSTPADIADEMLLLYDERFPEAEPTPAKRASNREAVRRHRLNQKAHAGWRPDALRTTLGVDGAPVAPAPIPKMPTQEKT